MERLRDDLLSVMACHPAIKVNRHLDRREMEDLLADLFACRMPHSCPHGRPTVIRFSLDEIERCSTNLKRIEAEIDGGSVRRTVILSAAMWFIMHTVVAFGSQCKPHESTMDTAS